MLVKGHYILNDFISDVERLDLLERFNRSKLFDESHDPHYNNSVGGTMDLGGHYDSITAKVKAFTGFDLTRTSIYIREYKKGGVLKAHKDREGLEMAVCIVLEGDCKNDLSVINYDKTLETYNLKNGDCVLLKGREIEHFRDYIVDDVSIKMLFVHWSIDSFEHTFIEDFLTKEQCKEIIDTKKDIGFVKSENKDCYIGGSDYVSGYLDSRLKEMVGGLELEGFSFMKYGKGNKFTAGYGSNKRALFTIIIYLNDGFEGGETRFATIGKDIKAKAGGILIFKNLKNGELDVNSLHEIKPILKGIKCVLVNRALI